MINRWNNACLNMVYINIVHVNNNLSVSFVVLFYIWPFYISALDLPTVITNNLISLVLCASTIMSSRFSCLEAQNTWFYADQWRFILLLTVIFFRDLLTWNIRKQNSTTNTFNTCLFLHVSKLRMVLSNALLISLFLCLAKSKIRNVVIPKHSI